MRQLSASKKKKLLSALKKYRSKYLIGKYSEVDESATRLMMNAFLDGILGYVSLDEIKTEYMIKGAYADYVIQIKGKKYFIVEVKAMPVELSQKHLRQAAHYAADEGIEWALLTNGKNFEFYKILFGKPMDSRKVFSIDLSDESQLKNAVSCFQYMTKDLLRQRGLDSLWNRTSALDSTNLSRMLYAKPIINNLKRQLKKAYKNRFSDEDVIRAVTRIIEDKIDSVKPIRQRSFRRRKANRFSETKEETMAPNPNPVQ